MTGSRGARVRRGVAAAFVATFIAALSHSVADREPAPLLGVVIALAFAVPACVVLAGKHLSWVRLSFAVGLSQFVFHGLLLIGLGNRSGAAFDRMAAPVHGHAEMLPAGASAAVGPMHHLDPGMWVAHMIAAAVTVLVIGYGERAIRLLLELTGWSVAARLLTWNAPRTTLRRGPVVVRNVSAGAVAGVAFGVSRRGPPVAA